MCIVICMTKEMFKKCKTCMNKWKKKQDKQCKLNVKKDAVYTCVIVKQTKICERRQRKHGSNSVNK